MTGVPEEVHSNPDGSSKRVDGVWFYLEPDFPNLAKVMLTILVIPHSNADAERIFSLVRKNDIEFRPNMGLKLLESTLITKINISTDTPCFKKEFTKTFLKAAKSCTSIDLKKSNSSDDNHNGQILADQDINIVDMQILDNPDLDN